MRPKHTIFILVLIPILFISGCLIAIQGPSDGVEVCFKADTDESMTLTEAKQIALAGECGEQGALKEKAICNEDTGTWWIDLDIEKEGCAPACVVNVITKEASINWRCTGVIPE